MNDFEAFLVFYVIQPVLFFFSVAVFAYAMFEFIQGLL